MFAEQYLLVVLELVKPVEKVQQLRLAQRMSGSAVAEDFGPQSI